MEADQSSNSSWIPFQEVDFSDKTMIQFHVDTRDFHCSCNPDDLSSLGDKINWEKLKKYPNRFFFTLEEVINFLNRIYYESGGKGRWRRLMLDIPNWENWNFKYIRIYRIADDVFFICNKDSYAQNRDILDAAVVKEYLNYISKI